MEEKDFSFTGYRSSHKETARTLRKEMTEHEKRLWYGFLRMYPVKFYRQRPIDQFIADFYCSKAKLVIEIDGSQHYSEEGMAYDAERSAVLEQYGLRVLRFSNREIDKNFSEVCERIDQTVMAILEEKERNPSTAYGGPPCLRCRVGSCVPVARVQDRPSRQARTALSGAHRAPAPLSGEVQFSFQKKGRRQRR